MLIGHIQNLETDRRSLPNAVRKALDFIRERDCANLAPGRYEIDGDDIFVLVQRYTTRDREACRAETHAKYVDIQYIAAGMERMGHAHRLPALEVEEDCLAARDAVFYKNLPAESEIVLTEGVYAILYPHDVHRPGCKVHEAAEVVKLVVKIHVDALE